MVLKMSNQPEQQQQQPLEQQQQDDVDDDAVLLTVSHEGRSCQVTVHQGETVLAALERQAPHLRRHLTGLPLDLPSDCRRGNCLTCAARVVAVDEDEDEMMRRSMLLRKQQKRQRKSNKTTDSRRPFPSWWPTRATC